MVLELEELLKELEPVRDKKKIVLTNGCFDILHAGHVDYLYKAKALGDILIVGLNSDSSIKRIKGSRRPIIPENMRAHLLDSLKPVDYVVIFSEDTPLKLIKSIRPDVLVKGEDWSPDRIVGRDFVESYGGKVTTVPFTYRISTTQIIQRILKLYCPEGSVSS